MVPRRRHWTDHRVGNHHRVSGAKQPSRGWDHHGARRNRGSPNERAAKSRASPPPGVVSTYPLPNNTLPTRGITWDPMAHCGLPSTLLEPKASWRTAASGASPHPERSLNSRCQTRMRSLPRDRRRIGRHHLVHGPGGQCHWANFHIWSVHYDVSIAISRNPFRRRRLRWDLTAPCDSPSLAPATLGESPLQV